MPPQPRHVVAEARAGKVAIGKINLGKCETVQKELQEACKAQLITIAIRRSEVRKVRALRDAVKHHNITTKRYE